MSPIIVPGTNQQTVFTSPSDLITKALKKAQIVGFGRNPTSDEILDGMQSLNVLLDELSVVRQNVSVRTSESFPLVIGQNIYGIGIDSNDFDTVRPIRIEQAFLRDSTNTDYSLDATMLEGEYSELPIKNDTSRPTRLFYKQDWTQGIITFDYLPDQAYTLFISSWKPFSKINDPGDETQLSYPDGYESMLVYNLADVIRSESGKPVDAFVHNKAMETLSNVQAAYGEQPKVMDWDIPFASGSIDPRSLFGK